MVERSSSDDDTVVNGLRPLLRRPLVGFVSGALLLAFVLFLFPRANEAYRGPADPHVAELQLSWSVERFSGILDTWVVSRGPGAIEGVKKELVILDFAFALVYAFLGGVLLTATWPRSTLPNWLLLAPFVAALADWIENIFLLAAIPNDLPLVPTAALIWLVRGTWFFAAVKFLLLLGTLAMIVLGVIRCCCSRLRSQADAGHV